MGKRKKRREKDERESPTSLYDLLRSVGRFSSGQELKIICSTKAWVPKIRDFTEDSSEEFGKSRVFGLGSVYGTS